MVTEDYVSFETAKLLKEKGFNEPCRLYYDKYHGYVPIFVEDIKLTEYGYKEFVRNDQNSISDFIASAPSLYVAMKWLRDEHKIHIQIWILEENGYWFDIEKILNTQYKHKSLYSTGLEDKYFDTYEEACESAIKYSLENLI